MSRKSAWVSLIASSSTLFCCVLPTVLVMLGMGATMAGLVSAVPQIVWLSQYKIYVFGFSFVMISFAAFMYYRSRNEPCPTDPELAKACASGRKWSFRITCLSASFWLLGFFFAFVAPLILS